MTRVATFGSGSWGTAFSMALADAGHDVTLWARRESLAEAIADKHENCDYLPGIELPGNLTATTLPERAVEGAEIVVLAVPSQSLRKNLEQWAELIPPDAVLVSLMKGIENKTLNRMSEVIGQTTGAGPERIAVLSGPNLAKEIARREPAASVVACADEAVAARLREAFHGPMFRPYSSVDVLGCELGGAYKNVIALCVGMAVGLGFGDNTTASVITRGLAETARLAVKMGADPITLMGLAGLGDLVATCSSPLSRNRTFGEMLGKGLSVEEATAEVKQVAEGVKSASSILALSRRHEVYAPVVEAVNGVIEGEITTQEMMESFVNRRTKRERD